MMVLRKGDAGFVENEDRGEIKAVGVNEPSPDRLSLAELHNRPYSKHGCQYEISRALHYSTRRLHGREAVHQKTSTYPSLDRLSGIL
jgi:hypothetical protein